MPAPSYVFFGTSNFAELILARLVKANWLPQLVVTLQAKRAGRRQLAEPTAVAKLATSRQLPTLEVTTLKGWEVAGRVREAAAEVGILASLGKLVPSQLIDSFPRGIVNVHPSLLPRWRGPAPIQYALLHGEQQTGVTLIRLDEELDHGPIIVQQATAIAEPETYTDLESRLALVGAKLL